jgi:hypothetical protein
MLITNGCPASERSETLKITYAPYRELVVHEIIEQANPEAFFEDIVRLALTSPMQVQPSINWIDGIAFFVAAMQPTEEVVRENLAGRVHYGSVLFTRTDFRPQVAVKIGNQDFTVRLRKANDNPTLVDLAAFLKDFKQQK